ncbi:MAG: phosphate ABC transporter permease PstA [Acidimicrobiales bacterium]
MTTIELPARVAVAEAALAPATTIPPRTDDVPARPARKVGGISTGDMLTAGGAFASSLCLTLLLFGRLAPFSGVLGFIAVDYLTFLLLYGFMTSLDNDRQVVVDKVMTVLFGSAAATAFVAVFSVIAFTLWKGRAALTHVNLYVNDMSRTGPTDPLTNGGIGHAIVGTLFIISVAMILTVPLGLACAVFLNESRARSVRLVRTIVDAMTALPSILCGLFIFATWVLILGFERSSLAASLAVGIMMLPIIIRSADVVLRLVPGNLREASAATGAPHWRTVWHVVLPTARPGLATAVILGVARGVGETAPVLLTSGFTASLNVNPTKNPMVSLPLAAFQFVRSPQPTLIARGFATAAVLMLLVLVLFTIARFLGGHPAGSVTRRQEKRIRTRSARDLARFDAKAVTL